MEKEWFVLFSKTIESEQNRFTDHILEYQNGVTNEELSDAENLLEFELPRELKSLLMEINGIYKYIVDESGEKIRIGSIFWGLAEIVDWYLNWTIPEEDSLFCLGTSITGNSFGYLLEMGKPKENEIWQSDHEIELQDEATFRRASSLKEFISTTLAESLWY